jgi:hypothetical protein
MSVEYEQGDAVLGLALVGYLLAAGHLLDGDASLALPDFYRSALLCASVDGGYPGISAFGASETEIRETITPIAALADLGPSFEGMEAGGILALEEEAGAFKGHMALIDGSDLQCAIKVHAEYGTDQQQENDSGPDRTPHQIEIRGTLKYSETGRGPHR